ncbi:hypothetical protein FKP32DRAFT_40983 [Trametes sanguinea]|nr:hypothetical protein FKP32DRAFT_40983 [Trametes sanguinea]
MASIPLGEYAGLLQCHCTSDSDRFERAARHWHTAPKGNLSEYLYSHTHCTVGLSACTRHRAHAATAGTHLCASRVRLRQVASGRVRSLQVVRWAPIVCVGSTE